MSDQCKNCQVKGDYNECIATECSHHENWINKEQIKRITKLENIAKTAQALCVKFINKVETGRARSIETYAECRELLAQLKEG